MCNYEDRQNTQSSTISRTSRRSDESYSSQSTAATSIYDDAEETFSNQLHRTIRHCTVTYGDESKHAYSRYSRASCGSGSEEGLYEEPEEYDYATPSYANPPSSIIEAIPTTPQDFAAYFPSQRRLNIQHDPTTDDGNMNLVISTEAFEGARKIHMQLFHLRMHDLATRQFSLRRYCRDSGREVCHSIASTGQSPQRPTLQRSMSHALATLSPGKRTNSWASTKPPKSPKSDSVPLERQDSGYVSNSDDEDFDDDEPEHAPPSPASKPSNTTKLEFSNYAHVDVKRRGGAENTKRWEFEYWGNTYAWKRESSHDGAVKTHSYHLVKTDAGQSQQPIAHIVPAVRTTEQVRAEARMGGWVPPCSLWISDARVLGEPSDVADVVVATGLIALADDCGRRLAKGGGPRRPGFMRRISIPMSPVKLDMEFVHPVEMVRHMFRRGSKDSSASEGGSSRPGTSRSGSGLGKSPLGFHWPVEAF